MMKIIRRLSPLRLYAIFGLMVVFTAWPSVASAQSRLPISVSNTALPATTLTDYTVRLDLDSTNAPGFDFTNNGDDLIAWNADTTAQLDFYVEKVDSVSSTAIVWVRVPSVPPSPPDTQIFLDYNRTDVLTPLSNASNTFVNNGFKYHSQPHTSAAPGPETRAAAEAEFNFDEVTANASYGCTSSLTEINDDHSSVFTQNGDFGLAITTHFDVSADALYEFRIGGDFGQGGELYVDDIALEADWTNDLWWATNFANADVLVGSRLLTAGSHTLRVLGYERCCDGAAELQYRFDSDGDGSLADETFSRLTTSSAGITLLAPSCPVALSTIGTTTTVPVTLAKFSSNKIGPYIRFVWETADETFNAGFNLWALVEEESDKEGLLQLNGRLVRSQTFDSMDLQRYKRRIRLKKQYDIKKIAISSVDINGVQEFFGPFELDEVYGETFVPQPVEWAKVHAEFEQNMQRQGYVLRGNRWRKPLGVSGDYANKKTHDEQSLKSSVQLGVQSTGIYRVTYEQLLAQGVNWAGVPRGQIAITSDGQAIPRAVKAPKRRVFGPGSSIDFVGVAPDDETAIYQSERFYQLQLDESLSLPVRVLRRKPSNTKAWHYKSQTLALDNHHLIFSPLKSPWVMGLMFRSTEPVSEKYQFELPPLVAGQSSHLGLTLGGIANSTRQDFDSDGALDPHHRFSILVNQILVEELTFDGQRGRQLSVDLPGGVLHEGSNSVEVRLEHSGYEFDVAVVDALTLSYPVENAQSVSLSFQESESVYDGFTFRAKRRKGLVAYTYRDDHNLMRVRPWKTDRRGEFQIPFISAGSGRYYVGDGSSLLTPYSIEKMDLISDIALVDSDLLIISHPSFIGETLDQYVEARRLQGVQSQVLSTDQISRNYGPDVPLHIAIQRFLKAASLEVDYEHVLLVGGHTYDYVGRKNSDNINFIPTFYTSIGSSRFTPSDQSFVDFDGDGYPEKSIGRWPVRQLSDLETITQKSIQWAANEASRTELGHGVLLLADTQREFNFAQDLDDHFSGLGQIQIGHIERVYIDEVAKEADLIAGGLNEAVQKRVIDSLSDGRKSWLFYNGHGSPNAWSFSQMLTASRVADLPNEDAPVIITSLGCYTTYYESPTHNSLAMQLMFAGNNAAAAITGPSVVGGYQNQLRLAKLIAEEVRTGRSVGGAIRAGMNRLPVNFRTAISNWALLADPSLPVQ